MALAITVTMAAEGAVMVLTAIMDTTGIMTIIMKECLPLVPITTIAGAGITEADAVPIY